MTKVNGPQNDPVLDSAQPRAGIFKRALDQVLTFLHIKSKPIEMRDIAVSETVDYKAQNQNAVEVFLKRKKIKISPNFEFQTKHVAQIAIHASNPKDAVDLANKFLKAMSYHKGVNKAHPDFVLNALMIDRSLKGKAIYNIQQDYNDTITAIKSTFPGLKLTDNQPKQLMKILIDIRSYKQNEKTISRAINDSDLMKELIIKRDKHILEIFTALRGKEVDQKSTNFSTVLESTQPSDEIYPCYFNDELGLEYMLVDGEAEYFVEFDNQEAVWLNYSEEDKEFWYEYADEYYIYNPATKISTPYYADEASPEESAEESLEESVDNVPAAPAPPPLPPVAPPIDGQKLDKSALKSKTQQLRETVVGKAEDARDGLLASIRKGKALRKTPKAETGSATTPTGFNTRLADQAAQSKSALPGADMQGADDDEWDDD